MTFQVFHDLYEPCKGKLADGKPVGECGRLTEGKIQQLQRYYGLAIWQKTLPHSNPSEMKVDIAVYVMKKILLPVFITA